MFAKLTANESTITLSWFNSDPNDDAKSRYRNRIKHMNPFDPYQDWLRIPSQLRPLNHYVLLGIQLFENNSGTIESATESRLEILKEFQAGPRGELAEQLMTEIVQAKVELLDSARKSRYDQELRACWADLDSQRFEADERDEAQRSDRLHGVTDASQKSGRATSPQADGSDLPPPPAIRLVETDREIDDGESGLASEGEPDSVLGLLLDIRVLVAMLSVIVIVMTATVLLFSKPESPGVFSGSDPVSNSGDLKSEGALASANEPAVKVDESNREPARQIVTLDQANDGSFELPLNRATMTKAKQESNETAARWMSGDQAEWQIAVTDPRRGYFYCELTYQAKSECQFAVQLGSLLPRKFTLYPHREDFTEQFIVKLDKSDVQAVRLIAERVESIADVRIKSVKLAPR